MGFYSGNFSFNGIDNIDMGVLLVNMDGDVLTDYGIPYREDIQTDITKNNIFYYSNTSEVETITLSMTLVDRNTCPISWTLKDKKRIIDWIVTDNFVPFVSEDDPSIIYYLKCIEYRKRLNYLGQGVIEFVMQPESQYAFSPVIEHVHEINKEYEFTINNLDNVNKRYYPKMEIIQFSDTKEDVIIKNLSTMEEEFVIKNLVKNERVEVDHLLKSITSNKEKYKLKDINRKWFNLKRGINKIQIKGNCEVKIITQFSLKV